MSRILNPGNPTNEARHIKAHPGYNGGEDCKVCKAWWKIDKQEDNWRYGLLAFWGEEAEETPEPEVEGEYEPQADFELAARDRERGIAPGRRVRAR